MSEGAAFNLDQHLKPPDKILTPSAQESPSRLAKTEPAPPGEDSALDQQVLDHLLASFAQYSNISYAL